MNRLNHSGRLIKARRDTDSKASSIEAGTNRGRSVLNRDLSLAVAEGEFPPELNREYALPANIRDRVDRSGFALAPSELGEKKATEQQNEQQGLQFPLPPSSGLFWRQPKGLQ